MSHLQRFDWFARLACRFRPHYLKKSQQRPHYRQLSAEPLEPRLVLAITTPVITEFMAANDSTIADGDGNSSDWIELYNPLAATVDLQGWYLTDDAANLTKWEFPDVSIAPGEYMLVFASGQPDALTGEFSHLDPLGFVHTNFKLSAGGESVLLVDHTESIVHGFVDYPPQSTDVSYGLLADLMTESFFSTPTPGLRVEDPSREILISEIMYNPSSGNPLEEYVEIYNPSATPVNLLDWQFVDGVDFTFPDVTIAAGDYLVIAADAATFAGKYPGVANFVGGWTGRLGNRGEKIELANSLGLLVDTVHYADEGDWSVRSEGPIDGGHTGWVWLDDHDGGGKSLEVVNPAISNDFGQNWAASLVDQGTPGTANSVAAADAAPLVLDVTQFPLIPQSTDPVTVTAEILDEAPTGATAVVHWRVDGDPSFSSVAMLDDGMHGDGEAGDGVYGAELPSQSDGTVVEFYVSATDVGANTRTWPAPTQPSGQQLTNLLYQVDDAFDRGAAWAPGREPIYYLIMTEAERAELEDIANQGSDQISTAQMNGTFISVDGTGVDLGYRVGIRQRGAGSRDDPPPSYRVNFPHDDDWKGVTAINLNAHYGHLQTVGTAIFRMAGLTVEDTVPAHVRVNGTDLAESGSQMFGSYAALEVPDSDYADKHFPNDPNGNIYKAASIPPTTANLNYLGTDPQAYKDAGYSKKTNSALDDWTDFINLVDVLNNSPDETYVDDVEAVLNVDEWLRWFATETLIGNGETNLSNGRGDDYLLYSGGVDPRFIVLPHDLDTILGQGDSSAVTPDRTIFEATSLPAIDRFLKHPAFVSRYYEMLVELIETTFTPEVIDPLIDEALGDYVPLATIDAMKQFVVDRTANVLSQIPQSLSITTDAPVVGEFPQTTNGSAALSGTVGAVETRSVVVGGQLAVWSPLDGTWSVSDVGEGGFISDTLVTSGHPVSFRAPQSGEDPTAWTALDFDDSAFTDSIVVGSAGVVVTEISTGDTKFVEIENVSDAPIDTTGWWVLVNNAGLSDVGDVNSVAWSLPQSMAVGEVIYRTDDASDNFWGAAIDWDLEGPGWAMIIDDAGLVMDFVAWGYNAAEIATLDIAFGAFASISVGAEWTGDGAPVGTSGSGGGGSPQPGTISYTGGVYTEDFDSIGPSGTATPAGWRAGKYGTTQNRQPPGSVPNAESLVPDDGSSSTKSRSYNYGAIGSSDRAIGHLPTTSTGDRALQVGFTNNTGTEISEFTLTYTGEQWREWEGGAPSPEKLAVYFSPDAGSGFTYLGSQWDFVAPQDSGLGFGGGTALDGNNPANRQTLTGTFALPAPVADGETFYITWHDQNDTTSDHALAVDDVVFEAITGPTPLLKRTGNTDGNTADDFVRNDTSSKGAENPDLTTPFGVVVPATTGLGFDDDGNFSGLIQTDVAAVMQGASASLWVRAEFNVTDPSLFDTLTLRMKYDDGFVAYLNGTEIARRRADDPLAFDSAATQENPDAAAVIYEEIDVSAFLGELQVGTNVLAIHSLNLTKTDTDFLMEPELVATGGTPGTSALNPGLNRIVVSALDGPDGTGNELERDFIDIWYDDGNVTNVSGAINVDTTWSAADGPFVVTGDITINGGATLTIEPGTSVFFNTATGISVGAGGRLLAEGTSLERIRFTRNPFGAVSVWDGFSFTGSLNDSRITFADMEYGDGQGESILVSTSQLLLDNVTWDHVDQTVLEVFHPSLKVANSVFPDISGGETVHGTQLSGNEYLTLEGNIFGVNTFEDLLDFLGADRPGPVLKAINNVFLGGVDDGLDLDGVDAHIEGNLFMNFHKLTTRTTTSNAIATGLPQAGQGGGGEQRTEITVVRNVFYDNDHGILLKEDAFATVVNNVFVGHVLGAIQFNEPDGSNVMGPGKGAFIDGNIFWDNALDLRRIQPETILEVHRSIITPDFHSYGMGNIAEDPRFADLASLDVRLLPGSPALGTGPNGLNMGNLVPLGASISGEPPAVTNQTDATLTVGGPGISHYKYRVNDGPFSAERPIGTPITLTGLANGDYTVFVLGRNLDQSFDDLDEADAVASKTWTVDTALARVRINEVLASNQGVFDHEGTHPDIIELFNDGAVPIELAGMSISDDADLPTKFVFPASTVVNPGEYLLLFADSDTLTSGLHLGFSLDADGEGVFLFDTLASGGALVDSVVFGPQIVDLSIGRVGQATDWALTQPTLGAENIAQRTGNPATLKINEWFTSGDIRFDDDFVELYNPDPLPVALAGLFLTDRPVSQPDRHEIAALSFVAGSGFVDFKADGNPEAGGDHLDFRLSSGQAMIGLFDAATRPIDRVVYYPQTVDVSQGRTPDGAAAFAFFLLPTPGVANAPAPPMDIVDNLRISEIMYNPIGGSEFEFVEFQNIGTATIDLTGVRLSGGIDFMFPNTTLAAGGYVVIVNDQAAFTSRYGSGINVAGQYASNLSNNGESLVLQLASPLDAAVLRFEYDNAWYPMTDGGGFSLVIVDPLGEPSSWREEPSWRPSHFVNGSPGRLDTIADITPPVVTAVVRSGSTDRFDVVTSLAFTFTEDVSASLDKLDLVLENTSTATTVDLTSASVTWDAGTNTATWDLTGVTIAPGFYTATLSAAGISDAAGNPLDGNSDGTGGDDFLATTTLPFVGMPTPLLVALAGDTDLDGDIDSHDILNILASNKFNKGPTAALWSEGDFDDDGDIDSFDIQAILATNQFGKGAYAATAGADSATSLAASGSAAEPIVFSAPGASMPHVGAVMRKRNLRAAAAAPILETSHANRDAALDGMYAATLLDETTGRTAISASLPPGGSATGRIRRGVSLGLRDDLPRHAVSTSTGLDRDVSTRLGTGLGRGEVSQPVHRRPPRMKVVAVDLALAELTDELTDDMVDRLAVGRLTDALVASEVDMLGSELPTGARIGRAMHR